MMIKDALAQLGREGEIRSKDIAERVTEALPAWVSEAVNLSTAGPLVSLRGVGFGRPPVAGFMCAART